MRRQTIEAEEFDRLVDQGVVVEQDAFGPKVLALDAMRMVKLFRRKRLVSSALFSPYADRFVRNARRLREGGIRAPRVTAVYRCPTRQRHLVEYERLSGTTLRELLRDDGEAPQLMDDLARLFASLHGMGAYFRSLHFGNVLYDHGQALALIDVADLRWHRPPLGFRKRLRNFAPLFNHPIDRALCGADRRRRLLLRYAELADLNVAQSRALQRTWGC